MYKVHINFKVGQLMYLAPAYGFTGVSSVAFVSNYQYVSV